MKLIISNSERRHLFWSVSIFFIVLSFFDAGVTYYFYLQEGPDMFVLLEANSFLSWSVENGIPFWLSPAIITNFLFIPLFWVSMKKQNRWFLIFLYVLPIFSVLHFYGGMTWLVYG